MNMLDEFIIRAIVAIFLLAINSSLAGSFTIFRDVPFLVAGSAHAALAGAALFIVLEGWVAINPFLGAVLFAILIAVSASRAKQANVAIGISFAFSMSLAVLFISLIKEQAARVWGLLFGDLLLLTDRDILMMTTFTVILLAIYLVFMREFLFISFDAEGAEVSGINVAWFNVLLLSTISLATVVAMKAVGAILVYAMLMAPAAAANRVAGSVGRVFLLSGVFALVAGFLGMLVAMILPVAPSAVAALMVTTIYFITLKRRE
ncbi:MAG TPA: ABC transporter permease [Thermoplasmatales archaeon]|nr:ABC transporter permease [Thermoplasmatales archaeon]